MKVARFLAVLLALLAATVIPSAAAPLAGPCAAGAAYDPACDVNHDGTIDIYDIQLTAGHQRQTGTYAIYFPVLQKVAYRFPSMVPKTGQTTSYAAGDDGALEKGVAWPNPRFTDNGNGTVTDNLTGLIWLKNANCFGQKNWATALSDANTLNSGECGLTDGSMEGDWRLPNLREMQSPVDYGQVGPALPGSHPFIGVQSSVYWASTTYAGFPSLAWDVNLNDGFPYANDESNSYYVWPVRGGQ